MQLIPVLDLRDGIVVHAVAGNRNGYLPLRSPICDSADPVAVARAVNGRHGPCAFYVADLGGIERAVPDHGTIGRLAAAGIELWVDGGARDVNDALAMRKAGAATVIVATETWREVAALAELAKHFAPEHWMLSIDLKQGTLLRSAVGWPDDPLECVEHGVSAGCKRLLLLDLAAVGMGKGPGTIELATRIRERYSELDLYLGGGFRRELHGVLASLRLGGYLVSSALHDGTLDLGVAGRMAL